jgi:hypothetical protein
MLPPTMKVRPLKKIKKQLLGVVQISTGRDLIEVPLDFHVEKCWRFPAEISVSAISTDPNGGFEGDPARMIRAVAARILRQILLVIVGAEAICST